MNTIRTRYPTLSNEIINLIKSRRTLSAYDICIITGYSGTSVRRVLRQAKKDGVIDSRAGVYFPSN